MNINHIGTQTLNTDRLILRRFNYSDSSDIFRNWAADPAVSRFWGWKPHESIEETQSFLLSWIEDYKNLEVYHWAIELKNISQAIGYIYLNEFDENDSCEVHFALSQKQWNQGLMSEACKAVLSFAFNVLRVGKVHTRHHIDNLASGRVMQKCSMKYTETAYKKIPDCEQISGDYCFYEISNAVKAGQEADAEQVSAVINHYNTLIDENNDSVHDPEPAKEYMDKWDGQDFIDELQLSPDKSVLEMGVGTGRLAVKVCDKCREFTGIDISPKTIERAGKNLKDFSNATLICADFMDCGFSDALSGSFDIIYSSLTFMHIKNKQKAISIVADLLKQNGRFILSTDKNMQTEIDYGNRKMTVYPDKPEETVMYIKNAGLRLEKKFETEFAYIFVAGLHMKEMQ